MKNDKKRVCLFIRVSSEKQDYDRQVRELTQYCQDRHLVVTKTIATKVSGAKTHTDRPDIMELFEAAGRNEFEKIAVTEISRIGRNAKDIHNTINFLHDRKISVIFQNLGGLESLDDKGHESFVMNIIISIYAELAAEERRILSERISSGLKNAKAKGKRLGRPNGSGMKKNDLLKKYSKLATDLKNGVSLRRCIKLHDLSKGTVLKVKRELR